MEGVDALGVEMGVSRRGVERTVVGEVTEEVMFGIVEGEATEVRHSGGFPSDPE